MEYEQGELITLSADAKDVDGSIVELVFTIIDRSGLRSTR